MPLRFLTAGESHGPAVTVIVEGLPAGVPVHRASLDRDLRRRMAGHGRGGRMQIESDAVEITAGVRFGRTLGSPVCLVIRNNDFASWQESMAVDGPAPPDEHARRVTRPRPGHADLAGALKFGTHDAREILERASARETAARTAAGALVRLFLLELGVDVTSATLKVGPVEWEAGEASPEELFARLQSLPDDAPLRCPDTERRSAMVAAIDAARDAGDSIGGVFEVLARGVPPGLGSHVHWDRRLDTRLGGALLSIPAVKAVSLGEGIEGAGRRGSEQHDPILYDRVRRAFCRPTNRAGGIEGGISNGEVIRARGYLKPLSTLPKPLKSIDLVDKSEFEAAVERTDTIPIVAAGVVGEAMTCLVLADAVLEKFGGDRLGETRLNLDAYLRSLEVF